MKNNLKYILILMGLSYAFLMLGNGMVGLTNPDEIFYAQTAKEMIKEKAWLTPYLFNAPQFEKPIFLYWLLRIAFHIFGINNFSARFFPAIFACSGVIAVYLLGLIGFKNEKKAFISGLILMSSALYIGLARTVFTDMVFSIFILISLLSFFWAYSCKNWKGTGILLFFIFSACAVLSKGPLGFLMPSLIVAAFLFIKKDLKYLFSKYFLWGPFIFALVSFPWYLFMVKKYGSLFIQEFFYNDHVRRIFEAEHRANDKWYFYPLVMISGMFPWSVFAATATIYLFKNLRRSTENIYLFLACWISAVLLICQPAHSKLASYIFPLFPAMAIMISDFIYNAVTGNKKERAVFYSFIITAIVLVIIPIALNIQVLPLSAILTCASSKLSIYILLSLLTILATMFLIFVAKGEFLKSIYVLICFVPATLCVVPLIITDIEPLLSSKNACAYLLENYQVDNTILCSKPFVRGVRYYTDKPIAVMAPNRKNFFSPHPIPFLDSDEKVAGFLRNQSVSYCVFTKSSAQDIERLSKEFDIEKLKVIGNEYIYKIEPK